MTNMAKTNTFNIDRDLFRRNLLKYTRKAYRMLPQLEKPRLLDIGCGSGMPTIELAKLSDGEITGVDNDQKQLDKLAERLKQDGLTNRIKIMNCPIPQMAFPAESFDIIWAEGSIFVLGFRKSLKNWRKFLKPGGFMVFHDDAEGTETKLAQIPDCGYSLIGHFFITKESWWTEYYEPLENKIKEMLSNYSDNSKKLVNIKKDLQEIERFKNDPEWFSSVFFIMQKK
jgi:ubiquinone/menaquinone biosynthesis C-methylase UbiE